MKNMTHKPDAVDWTEMHFINPHAKGVLCFCGADATHKVGEEIPRDDPYQNRHNFTQYVCCQCFVNIVGNAAFCGLTRDTAERDALRREVEAGKEKQADFVRITLDAVTEFFSHPGIKELRESLDASATEKLLALEEAFAALEGGSR